MTQMLQNNRYRIIRTLGSGGFGETFLAEDTEPLRRCVMYQSQIPNPTQIYELVQLQAGSSDPSLPIISPENS